MTNLNAEQYTAATAPFGHNLIIASAGTGKTSTIVARISHLLNLGILPEKILLLTFTNKAANEMISRLSRKFSTRITDKILSGTFHAVAYKILKRTNPQIALKEPSELKILLKSLLEKREFARISETKPYGGAYLYDVYSLFQNKELKLDFADWFAQNYDSQAEFSEIYADVLNEFELEKAKFGYVDFNDLLIKAKAVLAAGEIKFDEVLVDEYQDTNSLQGSLIDQICTKSLFCVGDFDQSIYAFNGANIEIISSFKDRYENAGIYALNVNYRSSASILALANKVIANNPRLYEKNLQVSREGKFPPPKLMIYNDLGAQSNGISELIAHSKYPKNDIAVIFRNNSSADIIEVALKNLGIAVRRKAGISFFESAEIKALCNLISIYINKKDIMAFIGTMEYAKKVGVALAKEIFDALLSLGRETMKNGLISPDKSVQIYTQKRKKEQLGLFAELDIIEKSHRFAPLGFDNVFLDNPVLSHARLSDEGAKMIYFLRNLMVKFNECKVASDFIRTASQSEAFSVIKSALATKRATLKSGKIDENLHTEALKKIDAKCEILLNLAAKYGGIYEFYNFLTLGARELSDGDGVNLMSVHSSKGLEFSQVFIIDLAQNRFPNFKLMNSGGGVEEERRLFYVAVTRAKDELILSYAKNSKSGFRAADEYAPSQFLIEAGMVKAH